MPSTRYTVTISRAHKLAERLKERSTELMTQAQDAAVSDYSSSLTSVAQIERVKQRASNSVALYELAHRYIDEVARVRDAIARANVATGISEMLAKQDALNRAIKGLSEIVKEASKNSIRVENCAPVERGAESVRAEPTFAVNVFSATQAKELADKLSEMQRTAYALSDRIAAANAGQISLEIDEALAKEIGL